MSVSTRGSIGDPTEEGDRHAIGEEAMLILDDGRAEASRVHGAAMTYDDMVEVAAAVLRSASYRATHGDGDRGMVGEHAYRDSGLGTRGPSTRASQRIAALEPRSSEPQHPS